MAGRSRVVVSGPFGQFVAGFAADLERQGFKPLSVAQQLRLVADLDVWLVAEGVGRRLLVRGVGAVLRGAACGWVLESCDGQGARSVVGVSARAGGRAGGERTGAGRGG